MTMTQDAHSARSLQDRVGELVAFIQPELHWCKFQYQLGKADEVDVSVGGSVVNSKQRTTPQFKLLECCEELSDWHKRFTKIQSDEQRLINRFSTPSPIVGVRVVPLQVFDTVMDRLCGQYEVEPGRRIRYLPDPAREPDEQSIGYRLQNLADVFCDDYPRRLELMEAHTEPGIWERVQHKLPSPARIRSHYWLGVTPWIFSGDIEVGHEAIARHRELVQRTIERTVENSMEMALGETRQKLAEALQNLHERLQGNSRITSRTFNQVRTAVEKLKLFKFVASDELLRQIDRFMERVGDTEAMPPDPETGTEQGMLDAISALEKEVSDATKASNDFAAFRRGTRRLR